MPPTPRPAAHPDRTYRTPAAPPSGQAPRARPATAAPASIFDAPDRSRRTSTTTELYMHHDPEVRELYPRAPEGGPKGGPIHDSAFSAPHT